jgi:hypothetical protein
MASLAAIQEIGHRIGVQFKPQQVILLGSHAEGRGRCDAARKTAADPPSVGFGVSRQAINNWLAAHDRGGDAALAAKQRGRPKERTIAPKQQAKIVRAIQG